MIEYQQHAHLNWRYCAAEFREGVLECFEQRNRRVPRKTYV